MQKISNLIKNDTNTLKKSFEKACSDKDFLNFIESTNIPDEILMKYTTRLQECLEEKKHCSKCRNSAFCKNKVQGYLLTPILEDKKINFSYVACSKTLKNIEKNKYKDNLHFFDISKEISEASFKGIYKDDNNRLPIIKYFKTFMEEYKKGESPKGLYLHGSFGSGKTYLIASLFNEMARLGVQSAYVYYPEFLRNLKASFDTNYEEKFNYIKKVELLLLDDIGAENSTSWARDEVLGPILQYRMEQHLPTFFTSNLTLEQLEDNLSNTPNGLSKVKARRIIERIKQLTKEIKLVSKNRRS